jgi:hypothetical protein
MKLSKKLISEKFLLIINASKQLLRAADDKHYHQQLFNAGACQRSRKSEACKRFSISLAPFCFLE